MKNFFLTILLVITSLLGLKAQTIQVPNLNAYLHTVTPGQCSTDGRISVTLPAGMGTSGAKVQMKLDIPNDAVGRTQPMEVGTTGKDSYTFTTLKSGLYTLTLIEVETGRRSLARPVVVTNQYVPPTFTKYKTTAPNCTGSGKDGSVAFTIQAGAKGPFVVKLVKLSGNVTIFNQTFTKAVASNPLDITLQGDATHPIEPGNYELSVQDLADNVPDCGETNKQPVTILQPTLSLACIDFRINHNGSGIRMDSNCKFGFSFQIEATNGINISNYESQIKATPRAAVVKRYNSAGVFIEERDLSSFYASAWLGNDVAQARSFRTPYIFEEGDIVELEINIGKTPITRKFKIDANLVDVTKNTAANPAAQGAYIFRDGSGMRVIEASNRSDMSPDPGSPCPPPNTKQYLFVDKYLRSLKLPNPDNASEAFNFGQYYWFNDFYNNTTWVANPALATPSSYYYDVYEYKGGTTYPGAPNNFFDETDTNKWRKLTPGIDYNWINANYADLSGSTNPTLNPRAYYMVIFRGKKADGTDYCYQPKRVVQVDPLPNQLEKRFSSIEKARGVFKNTIAIRKWLSTADFNYPLTVELDYLEDGGVGTRTYQFTTSLPFETAQRTVTYTFPIRRQFLDPEAPGGSASAFIIGDLPPGQYRITFIDNCGNTASRVLDFDTPMVYDKDEVKVVPGCATTSKISYEISVPTGVGTINDVVYQLYRKNTGTGEYTTWVGSSNNPSHTFNNLPAGDYMFVGRSYYYARVAQTYWSNNAQTQIAWSNLAPKMVLNGQSMIDSPDLRSPSRPEIDGTVYLHRSRVYLTISPTDDLKRDVVGTTCAATNGTGIVAVQIKNPQSIRYPLQFILKNKATGTVVSSSATFQEGSGVKSYVFKGLTDATYVVVTSHLCGDYPDEALVSSNSYTEPGITYVPKSTSPCNGDEVELTFGGSAQLFNIQWFRVETNGTETSIGVEQVITDTVNRATQYLVRYSLKDTSLCVVNASGVASYTVQFVADSVPPVITGCPTGTITVNAMAGQCYGVAHWGTVTATDDCRIGTWSQSHQSGDRFPIGLHTVTYVFNDTSGNTATCTFNVLVKSDAIKMIVSDDYVDGAGSVIPADLSLNQNFYYRVRYENQGTQYVTSATMQISLPTHPNITVGTPDFSKANQNTAKPTLLGQVGNTLTIQLPKQSLAPGVGQKEILIPLSLKGECSVVGKPCMNLLKSTYTFTYEGGSAGCVIPAQTNTSSKTILISTQECVREELSCATTARLNAITGFDEYRWFKNGVQQANPLNNPYFDTTDPATYKVEKITVCDGTTYTTTEEIQLKTATDLSNPISGNGRIFCVDRGIWTTHIILCNQPSRTLKVNFKDTTIEWQTLKAGNNPESDSCPNINHDAWETVATTDTFVVNATAHHRIRLTGAGGCVQNFYFDVFASGISGEIINPGNITSYQSGQFTVKMATSGLTYKYVLKDSFGNVVPQNGQTFIQNNASRQTFYVTTPNTYTVEVSSPNLPNGCTLTLTQKIEKVTTLSAKAVLKDWKNCNHRVINFSAEGGKANYSFAIWSIDGITENGYNEYGDVPASAFFTTDVPGTLAGKDENVNITQPGKYIFLAKDANGAYALTPEVDIEPEGVLNFSVSKRDILCGFANNTGQISTTFTTQQNVHTILYRKASGGALTRVDDNATGFYNQLTAGTYDMEIRVTRASSSTCTYWKRNIVINNVESNLRAFAGVAEDISCDTSSPTKEYLVRINNVSGGTGTGYEFSANNVSYTTQPILRVGSTASVVYVRDSNKCTLEIPITIHPITPATVTASTITYDCDGRGTFTITTQPTGTYQYQLTNSDGTISETRTSNVFTLSPGVYSIYALYTPQSVSGTTPNILFEENFGTGLDTCDSDIIYLTCQTGAATLEHDQYVITQQAPANANWVSPTPIDATGLTDGRYLAINGKETSNNNGIAYRKEISDVIANQPLTVSLKMFNLLPPSYIGGTNPNFVIRLYNPGNPAQYVEKSLGELQRNNTWEQKTVTFAANEITLNRVVFEVRNVAAPSLVGSDFAIDDIQLSQPTKVCAVRADGLTVNVANDRRFSARGNAYDELCGKGDGGIYLTVDNDNGNTVQYRTKDSMSWTTVTLSATTPTQGTATITGLSATQSGTLFVRKGTDPNCMTSFDYVIKKPVPLTVTATVVAPVSCLNTLASVRLTADGGARPYTTFRYYGTPGGQQAAVNNEADVNLPAGSYTIEVVDKNGCTATATFVVPDVVPLQIAVVDLEPCFSGGANGSVQLKVLGGNGGYQFSKDGGVSFEPASGNDTSMIFDNLTAGTYNFVVKDAGACQTSTSYTIYNPLRMQVLPVAALSCQAGSQAEYTVAYSGGAAGSATREFLWSHQPNTNFTVAIPTGMSLSLSGNVYTFKTTIEGDYYFKVRYLMDNGDYCEIVSAKQEVKVVAPAFVVTPTIENVNCAGANTGKVVLSAANIAGGTVPYTLLLFNGTTTTTHSLGDLTGLAVGNYTLTIQDDALCTSAPFGFTISQTAAMVTTITTTPLQCSGTGTQLATAKVEVTSGGSAPFKLTLLKNGIQQLVRANVATNQVETFNNLDVGQYRVLIEDAKGCSLSQQFSITSEANGFDARTTPNVGCVANSGELAVSVYNLSGEAISEGHYIAVYREGINRPINPSLSMETTLNADGATNDNWYRAGAVVSTTLSDGSEVLASTYTFTGLTPGVKYTFIVFNPNDNCTFIKEANIAVPTLATLKVQVNGTASTTCFNANDGKLFVHLSDWTGTPNNISYRVYTYPPTHPLTDPSIGAVGAALAPSAQPAATGEDYTIQGLPAGRYFVLFTDVAGGNCTVGSDEFTIGKSPSQLTATATVVKQANCKQPAAIGLGKITLDVSGGQTPYQYYYHDNSLGTLTAAQINTNLNNSTENTSKDVASGSYTIYIRDAVGCLTETTVTVTLAPAPAIRTVNVLDACTLNADYPISVVFSTIGVGQHQYKIDGITSWQNISVVTQTTLPIRLAPSTHLYTISFRDANGCETSTTFRVNEMIAFQASHSTLLPCGGGTATITVSNITGGTGAYRLSLYRYAEKGTPNERLVPLITADNVVGSTYVTGSTVSITAGAYRINVYDAATFGTDAECARSLDFSVAPPIVPEIEILSVSTPTCYQDKVTIRAKVTPVSEAPYVFRLLNPSTMVAIPGVTITPNVNYVTIADVPSDGVTLGGIAYLITAESTNSCTVEAVVTATSPDLITVGAGALTKDDYQCERDAQGYLTDETTYPQLHFQMPMVAGGTHSYTRVEFRELATNNVVNQQTVEAGVTSYTYVFPSYLTAANSYYVSVYDSNGCSATSTAVTISPTLIMSSLTASQTQAYTCANGSERVSLTISTTTVYSGENIQYSIYKVGENSTLFAPALLNSLTYSITLTEPGTYLIKALNQATGCEILADYTVLDPNTITLEAKNPVRVQCKGGTGEITLELTDARLSDGDQVANGFTFNIYQLGTGTSVDNGTTLSTLTPSRITRTNLPAGKYGVEATSIITGCKAYTTFELVEAENPITVFSQETQSVTCDNNRGEILVTVSGGWAPYRVSIQGGSISQSKNVSLDGDSVLFKGLVGTGTPGGVVTYTVSILDKWNCNTATGTVQVGLLSPDTITATISVTQQPTCFGSSDGIITVLPSTLSGGSGTYYYTLIDANYVTVGPKEDPTFENLLPGVYAYEIMDTWGCKLIKEQIQVEEPKPISVTVGNSNLDVCYRGSDAWLEFTVDGGRPPYTVDVINKYTSISVHNETGVLSTTNVRVLNMPAADYRILITDSSRGGGCTMSPSYEFTVNAAPDLETENKQGYACDNNEFSNWIEVRFKDPVDFSRLTYKLNGAPVAQTFSRNNGINVGYIDQTRFNPNVATQTLQVIYTNVHSVTGTTKLCSSAVQTITIEPLLQLNGIQKIPTTVPNTLKVEGVRGKTPYRYEFNGTDQVYNNVYELKLTDRDYVDPVNNKTYKTVNVTIYDAAGCVYSRTFYEEYFDVMIPNFFTPNGDGEYDTWAPRYVQKYPQIRVSIFDRYGRRLKVLGYGEEWDGKYEGALMPVGDYWYIVELSDEHDTRVFNGNFTLYR